MILRYIQRLCVASIVLCLGVSCLVHTPAMVMTVTNVEMGETPNAKTTGQQIYFGGQPAPEDFAIFQEKGVKTVINLRSQEEVDELTFSEKEIVEGLGMRYVHVPVNSDQLGDDRLRPIVAAIAGAGDGQMLIHCASGNRVGFAWSLFRGTEGGEDVAAAITQGKAAGMRSEELEARARTFLEEAAQGRD